MIKIRNLIHATVMALGLLGHSGLATANVPTIVIIIDDIGYRATDNAALTLPTKVAMSILPHTPFATSLANQAAHQQRDVMLHLPMTSTTSEKRLGPGAITTDMYPQAIVETLDNALRSVPNAIGVNNHMGSLLTQQRLPMNALMSAIKKHHLFFIDSRTTAKTIAQDVATTLHVPNDRRHVFLDHEVNDEFMEHEFNRLVALAHKKGNAIGIAHPHPQTIAFLTRKLPLLADYGVKLSSLRENFPQPSLRKITPTSENTQEHLSPFEE